MGAFYILHTRTHTHTHTHTHTVFCVLSMWEVRPTQLFKYKPTTWLLVDGVSVFSESRPWAGVCEPSDTATKHNLQMLPVPGPYQNQKQSSTIMIPYEYMDHSNTKQYHTSTRIILIPGSELFQEHTYTRTIPVLATYQYQDHIEYKGQTNTRNIPVSGTYQYQDHTNTRTLPVPGSYHYQDNTSIRTIPNQYQDHTSIRDIPIPGHTSIRTILMPGP